MYDDGSVSFVPLMLAPLHNKIIPEITINTLPIEISEDCKVRLSTNPIIKNTIPKINTIKPTEYRPNFVGGYT